MTGGLSVLTALALQKGDFHVELYAKIFASMALTVSGGFAINDYFDQKADALVKPNRPIPSGAVSSEQALIASALLFFFGLAIAFLTGTLALGILFFDTVLLISYSAFLKKHSGILSNLLVGALIGTSFLYGEASVFNVISVASFSLALSSFGSVGGNILRDVLSLDGDIKAGYPTMPQEIGVTSSVKASAVFLLLSAFFSPFPYLLGVVKLSYLFPIVIWDCAIVYSALSLLRKQDLDSVKKQERIMTMTMILLPIALIVGTYI
jgi:geranylgeranylglycerol-phosphate geranylgeranyltransferase